MNIFCDFDRTFIISLPSRLDRRRQTEKEFADINVDFKQSGIEFFDAICPEEWDGWPKRGAKGSLYSHTEVLKIALSRGYEKIIMLEDDICFSKTFQHNADKLRPLLKNEKFDVFMGGRCNVRQDSDLSFSIDVVEPDDVTIGAHFLIFTKEFMVPFVEYLELVKVRPKGHPKGGAMYFDGAFNMFRSMRPDLTVKIIRPVLALQRSSSSDITPGLKDRIPVVREICGLARNFNHWLQSLRPSS